MKTSRNCRKERISFIALLSFVGLLASGCSDDPSALNSVGTQLLRTRVIVRTDTLGAVSSSTFRQHVPMDGRTNLLGISGGYRAYLLIQFYPAYLPQRDTVNVLSASLGLRAVTWSGDSTVPFGFNVYETGRSWGQSTFQWDSLGGLYNSDPGSIRGTYSGTIARDTEWVNTNLDTAMVRRWLQPVTYTNNYGIILVPTPNAQVVRGFHAMQFGSNDSLYPQLTVIARNVAGTVIDTTIYKVGQDTFVGNIDNLNSNPELIYAQAGVPYRGTVKFDVSSIPRGAIVNQAQLTLTYSPASSRLNRFTADTAIAAHALLDAVDYSKFDIQGSRSSVDSLAAPRRFTLDIRRQLQYWIRDPAFNNGLLLRSTSTNEFSSFDLFTFYNQIAQDATKRPQLIVKYTVESN